MRLSRPSSEATGFFGARFNRDSSRALTCSTAALMSKSVSTKMEGGAAVDEVGRRPEEWAQPASPAELGRGSRSTRISTVVATSVRLRGLTGLTSNATRSATFVVKLSRKKVAICWAFMAAMGMNVRPRLRRLGSDTRAPG